MKSDVKKLVERVFASMEDDAKRLPKITEKQHRRLVELTCEPLKVDAEVTLSERFKELQRDLVDKLYQNFCVPYSTSVRCEPSKYTWFEEEAFEIRWREQNGEIQMGVDFLDIPLYVKHHYPLTVGNEVVRPLKDEPYSLVLSDIPFMKPSRAVGRLIDVLFGTYIYLINDCEKLKSPDAPKTFLSIKNRIVKDFSNKLSLKDYYVYFVKYDYADHYLKLREAQNLSSCMTISAERFGNRRYFKAFENSTALDSLEQYAHPLEGYHYSPDFRLALWSNLSPEELKALPDDEEDYPFVARQVSFLWNEELSFSKVYGLEAIQSLAYKQFKHVKHPMGKRLYGIMCSGVSLDTYLDTDDIATEAIASSVSNPDYEYHIIAPYVDTWCNYLNLGDVVEREDGALCKQLYVTHRDDKYDDTRYDYDDDDFDVTVYEIYHSSGMVREERYLYTSNAGAGDDWYDTATTGIYFDKEHKMCYA